MSTYSLDTDAITKLLKKHPGNRSIVNRFRREIQWNSLFIICTVVCYEVRRGFVRPSLTPPQSEILRCAQNDRG
jgi:predicted nucleic acid-binding protein